MDAKTALHTAARRFCGERFSEWVRVYSDLKAKENYRVEDLFEVGWQYSEVAYRIFPRYRTDGLIKTEIEKLISESARDLAEMRGWLIAACASAENRLLAEFALPTARKAINEEAADFRAYVCVLQDSDLAEIPPLPYRRVLTEQESQGLWNKLKDVWDIGDGYWFPLREGQIPQNVLTFHMDYFRRMKGSELVREALETRGISRVFQLCELKSSSDPEYEIELSVFEPRYANGGEQYSTSESADWIVYASHESSITLGGDWLINIVKKRWPDWNQRAYGGPYSTNDMRGTWKLNE